MTILEGQNITKTFGGLTAVDGVDIEIEEGEIVGLIGPNGAGKSSLFNCITGTYEMDDGSIQFRGDDISELAEHQVAQQGLMRLFQEVRIYDEMTLYENLLVSVDHSEESTVDMFRRYPEAVHEQAEDLLKYVGLWEKRDIEAGELSYGQRKLLEFAMLLLADPDMLLLDEPAGGINPTMIEKMLDFINDVNEQQQKTLLVIEHNMEFIMRVSDRIYVMANGEVIAEGDPETIQNSERVKKAYLEG